MDTRAGNSSEPLLSSHESASGGGVRADLELAQLAVDRERAARRAESAAARVRLTSLEAALADATRRSFDQKEMLARQKRLWFRTAVLVIAGGVLLQAMLYYRPPRPEPEREEIHVPKRVPASDSPLRKLALLPTKKEEEPVAPDLARAARVLGTALAQYPEQDWPDVLIHVRRTNGREVCPFLWIGGTFAFILPEVPAGIGSLPAALERCAEAVARPH